jgi:hypothetical protein
MNHMKRPFFKTHTRNENDKNILGVPSDTIHTRVEQSNLNFSVRLPIVQF